MHGESINRASDSPRYGLGNGLKGQENGRVAEPRGVLVGDGLESMQYMGKRRHTIPWCFPHGRILYMAAYIELVMRS